MEGYPEDVVCREDTAIVTYRAIVADAGGLPASIVATGVGLVELVAVVLVPAHVENGYSKRAFACQTNTQKISINL